MYLQRSNEKLDVKLRESRHFLIRNNGTVTAEFDALVTIFCRMDFSLYPNDVQRCPIVVGSLSSSDRELFFESDFDASSVDVSSLPFDITYEGPIKIKKVESLTILEHYYWKLCLNRSFTNCTISDIVQIQILVYFTHSKYREIYS